MDQATLIDFKLKLQAKLAVIEADIVELKKQVTPISPDDAYGRVSRMDAINNKAVIENSLRLAKAKRSKLIAALGQVDNTNFGKCMVCNGLIAIERLLFMPEANKCMSCAR